MKLRKLIKITNPMTQVIIIENSYNTRCANWNEDDCADTGCLECDNRCEIVEYDTRRLFFGKAVDVPIMSGDRDVVSISIRNNGEIGQKKGMALVIRLDGDKYEE